MAEKNPLKRKRFRRLVIVHLGASESVWKKALHFWPSGECVSVRVPCGKRRSPERLGRQRT